jgi:magnesium chelatase accessory protein
MRQPREVGTCGTTARRCESWERVKATWPNHELSKFIVAGGVRWHVQAGGDGPSMLLVHGTGASSHSWRDLIPILGRHFRILAVDLPGHGFTDEVSPARRSIEGMSESLGTLLAALAFNPVHCVGHSAGAVIACRMALDLRIAPSDIISINGAFLPPSALVTMFSPLGRLLSGSFFLPNLLARQADNRATVERLLAGTGSRLDSRGVDLYQQLARRPEHIAGALGMMGSWDLTGFERELSRLRARLVLIVGENDRTVPPAQALVVARRLAGTDIVTLPGLGHLAHEEAPILLAQEIIKRCAIETVHAVESQARGERS